MPSRIYLDHAATTPLLPAAQAAMAEGFAHWANPSSPHAEGRAARATLERARAEIATALGWRGEVILTGGASEALALALGRSVASRQIVSAIEHDAVFRAAPHAMVIPVLDGELDLPSLQDALRGPDPAIVAIQAVNSETGTILLPLPQDPAIATVRAAHGLLLCDASQLGPGRTLPPEVDMAVISGHKLGGPIGIGALLVRDFAMLHPSGGQERGYRTGTENLPGALGLAAALAQGPAEWRNTAAQRFEFQNRLSRTGDILSSGHQCSHILALVSPRFDARALLIRLDALGFAVSAGSACSSGSLKPSRVLTAFGVSPETAARTIRVSLGWTTTPDDLAAFAAAWERLHA